MDPVFLQSQGATSGPDGGNLHHQEILDLELDARTVFHPRENVKQILGEWKGKLRQRQHSGITKPRLFLLDTQRGCISQPILQYGRPGD